VVGRCGVEWYNEPPLWHEHEATIDITTAPGTDFWRTTLYGFIHDNGHFYYQSVAGDFTASVVVRGAYTARYDQAGLMVRVNETTWLKCGIEFVDGVQYASAVVTREYSDWSVAPLAGNPSALWLRVQRRGDAVDIEYACEDTAYTRLRLAHLDSSEPVQVGPTAASPDGPGFQVIFEDFTIDKP